MVEFSIFGLTSWRVDRNPAEADDGGEEEGSYIPSILSAMQTGYSDLALLLFVTTSIPPEPVTAVLCRQQGHAVVTTFWTVPLHCCCYCENA